MSKGRARRIKKENRKSQVESKIKMNRDDFFMIVFTVLGTSLIIAFYFYLKNLHY